MAFLDRVAQLDALTFPDVIRSAAEEVPRFEWARAWEVLEHGRTILEDEDRLNKYLVAYGLMHRAKILHMLDAMRGAFKNPAGRVSIVDWGCGQGLASAVFVDWLRKNLPRKRVASIRLVEVSNSARNRAGRILKRYSEAYDNVGADVKEVRWIPGVPITMGELELPADVPVVHLYSNILDVEEVDRQMLADIVEQSRQMPGVLALCVSPQCSGAEHIFDFFRLVGGEEMIVRDSGLIRYENPYARKISCSFTGCGFLLPSLRTIPLTETAIAPAATAPDITPPMIAPDAPEQRLPAQHAVPPRPVQRRIVRRKGDKGRTYAFGFSSTPFRDAIRSRPGWWTYNLALTRSGIPCDGGVAGLNPFLAVINNMIVRGRAAYPPISLEKALADSLGIVRQDDGSLGTIDFSCSPEISKIADRVLKTYDPSVQHGEGDIASGKELESRVFLHMSVPMMAARVQHALVRALMTGAVDWRSRRIRILALERDVPCVAVALETLAEHFGHLSGLCGAGAGAAALDYDITLVREVDGFADIVGKVANGLGGRCILKSREEALQEDYDIFLDVSFFNNAENAPWDAGKARAQIVAELYAVNNLERSKPGDFTLCTTENIEYSPVIEWLTPEKSKPLPSIGHLRYFLQEIFRKSDFRPGQIPILDRAMRGLSVIGLLPTGGGKSLTYQLAGMLQPGLVMVVDPLQSLMVDQVKGLERLGIDSCQYLNSSLRGQDRDKAMAKVTSGNAKFVFISPERLSIPSFRFALAEMADNDLYFSYGVIDEVHCVSEWGHDFRPMYLHLGRNMHDYVLMKNSHGPEGRRLIPLLGLTATASFDVLADVQRELSGRNREELAPDAIVRYENTNRLELQYRVVKVANPGAGKKREWVDDFMAKVRPLDAQIEALKEKVANGDVASSSLLREAEAKRKKIVEGDKSQDGWRCLNVAQRSYRKFVNGFKYDALKSEMDSLTSLFKTLQTPQSIKRIKDAFLERESITKEENPEVFDIVANSDLGVDFSGDDWKAPDADGFYRGGGLVFCPIKGFSGKTASPLSVEGIWTKLAGDSSFGSNAVRWFSGEIKNDSRKESERWRNQDEYIAGRAGLMVATNAFGMGIDKPDIRFVYEISHPKSLEAFVQEAGRAGRDRKMALATLLLSEFDDVDLDVVKWFHDQNFIGEKQEGVELEKILTAIDMRLEAEETGEERMVKGFLESLLSTEPGTVTTYVLPELSDGGMKDILEKSIYRLCCIGVVDDVECLYGGDSRGGSTLRLRMVRRTDDEYYGELKTFLARYFTVEKSEEKVAALKAVKMDAPVIKKCLLYLTSFVYENVERKRARAMLDMHAFCRQGCRDLAPNETWLDVNEELKDWIYFYFNSKYARTGNTVKIDGKDMPYSLVDDTDNGKRKDWDRQLLEKYLAVVEDRLLENNSPKDNVKHLQGAVRLIRRAETGAPNPVLSLLNVFCLCFLGFKGNDLLLDECVKSLGPDGFGQLLATGQMGADELWDNFDWFAAELKKRAPDCPKDVIDDIVETARLEMHLAPVRELLVKLA